MITRSSLRVGGLRFKTRADLIGHSVAKGLPPLRHFFERSCVEGCNDAEMDPENSLHDSGFCSEYNQRFNLRKNFLQCSFSNTYGSRVHGYVVKFCFEAIKLFSDNELRSRATVREEKKPPKIQDWNPREEHQALNRIVLERLEATMPYKWQERNEDIISEPQPQYHYVL